MLRAEPVEQRKQVPAVRRPVPLRGVLGLLDREVRRPAGRFQRGKGPREQLVGKLVAERAKEAGVEKVAFDRSGYKYHGRVKALADAARESGLEF